METREIIEISCPTLPDFRRHLRITSKDLDAELSDKLRAATRSAENEISTVIAPSIFTLSSSFKSTISLRWPVRSVTSVKVDGEDCQDYEFDEGSLTFAESVTGKKVVIVYEAGLVQVPEDIRAAILLLAGSLFNNPTDRPEERDRTTARNLLRPYRSWGEH